jgi:hypothetical protein
MDWRKLLTEDEIWMKMFEEPTPSDVPTRPGFRLDGLQLNLDSILHLPTSTNQENRHLDPYLDSLLVREENYPAVGEMGSIQGNTGQFDETFAESFRGDLLSSNPWGNNSSKICKHFFLDWLLF